MFLPLKKQQHQQHNNPRAWPSKMTTPTPVKLLGQILSHRNGVGRAQFSISFSTECIKIPSVLWQEPSLTNVPKLNVKSVSRGMYSQVHHLQILPVCTLRAPGRGKVNTHTPLCSAPSDLCDCIKSSPPFTHRD